MVPRSLIEVTIDQLAKQCVADLNVRLPHEVADIYVKAHKCIREKVEAELEIDETK